MTYQEVLEALMVLGAIPQNSEDSNFQKVVPAMFKYADGRIYRDLNFLAIDTTFPPLQLTPSKRDVALPEEVLTVHHVNLCTPSGAVTDTSRRIPLERVSEAALNMFWPNPGFKKGRPKKFTVIGNKQAAGTSPSPLPPTTQPRPPVYLPESYSLVVRLMPTPDLAYAIEVNGSGSPAPLSNSNPETYVSRRYPELLIACCMVYITGYQRDYGAASEDPQRGVSWEQQYQTLKAGIELEASMQRGEGPAFTTLQPAPIAQTPR